MFIKLNFTSNKNIVSVFRLVNEIINQPGITSAGTLSTYLTANNADATVIAGYDPLNSTIIRTVGLSTAKSHYARGAASTNGNYFRWTVEFQAHDSTRKYYIQHVNESTTLTAIARIGDTLTGGTMSSSQMAISVANSAGTPDGTTLTVTGSTGTKVEAGPASCIADSTNAALIRSFWMHISDNGMIWATTNTTTTNLGFGSTYNNPGTYSGPWIYGQYARDDYFNTDANTVFPLMYTNLARTTGKGFGGETSDWVGSHNSMAGYPTYTTTHPFKVVNLVSAHPQSGSSWPIIDFPVVNWGVSNRFDETYGLTQASSPNTNTESTITFTAAIFTAVNTRYPSADLKAVGFAMLPITWRHTYYGNTGGNMSEKSGYYLFNGDYFPGDQFTYGGKTYVIFSTYVGYVDRVGIAVPME
jgi:hypothetical protein